MTLKAPVYIHVLSSILCLGYSNLLDMALHYDLELQNCPTDLLCPCLTNNTLMCQVFKESLRRSRKSSLRTSAPQLIGTHGGHHSPRRTCVAERLSCKCSVGSWEIALRKRPRYYYLHLGLGYRMNHLLEQWLPYLRNKVSACDRKRIVAPVAVLL